MCGRATLAMVASMTCSRVASIIVPVISSRCRRAEDGWLGTDVMLSDRGRPRPLLLAAKRRAKPCRRYAPMRAWTRAVRAKASLTFRRRRRAAEPYGAPDGRGQLAEGAHVAGVDLHRGAHADPQRRIAGLAPDLDAHGDAL